MDAPARVVCITLIDLRAAGIAECLSLSGLDYLATCQDASSALELIEAEQPELVIIGELDLPHHGFVLARKIVNRWPGIRTILLHRRAGETLVQADAAFMSTSACLPISVTCDDLADAARNVLAGALLFTPEQVTLGYSVEPLTQRQLDVLKASATPATASEVASKLNIRLSTIKTHQREIRAKLGVNSTALAIERGRRRGLM